MKHKKEVFIAALIIVFLIAIGPSIKKQVGIYTKGKNIEKSYFKDSLYDIYITNGEGLGLIQISNIQKGNINYSKIDNINVKYDSANFLFIEKDLGGEIYVPYSSDIENPKNANRLLIFNEGKLEDEIEFDDIRNPQTVISDRENNRILLEQNITVQPEDSQGLKLKVIDTTSKEVIKELYLKGYIRDYYVGEKEIVLSLEGAKKLCFLDAQDRSLYAINRETLEGREISKEPICNVVNALCGDSKGNNVIFTNITLKESGDLNKNEIIVMDSNGEIKERKEVLYDMNGSFYGNEKYEYVLNGKIHNKNNGFLIFNKETLEFEKLVDDVKDISYIESLDGYLFILTRDSKLFIYDENTLEQIGSIELEGEVSHRMKVIKKKG
ncbi:hypothetical protein JJB67_07610 [Clostridium perfringens]|uniref:hypothetical protein n=1 Tax=Clostridium perfringens TaxID=1502 RepID=UPI000D70EBB5|nr:hypothetical protein [Clostridium perfringens]MBO3322205.1 hypothetical protein [Clostridium perfringens]MBO3331371.1 hypothetical protein [Clostridium perfringens]NGT03775.1 hypothetical protein [Clostridium perfringens]PWX02867.1 hypothetical protein CYK75_05385 [Clostridium perfringens]PWX03693.1 hypothetical protein CYK73_07050 [Clostridium perfringens]